MNNGVLGEHDLQRLILDYLKLHRIFHWRQNVGGMKRGKHFVRFGVKGLPDICCIMFGRFVGIEVKRDKVDQSQAQIGFQMACNKAGGRYLLARSLQDVIDVTCAEWKRFEKEQREAESPQKASSAGGRKA